MTDKELFEKTQKHFNLTKKSIVVEVFNKGNFNKFLNEIRGSEAPSLPSTGGGGGFLSRIAAAIPGTRGHRMRSAQARTMEADAKKAEVSARFDQQQQMKGFKPKVARVSFKVGDRVKVITLRNPDPRLGKVTEYNTDTPTKVKVKIDGGRLYRYDVSAVTKI